MGNDMTARNKGSATGNKEENRTKTRKKTLPAQKKNTYKLNGMPH